MDRAVLPERTYYYHLEVIALDGSADWAGPVSVSSRFVVYTADGLRVKAVRFK